MDLARALIEVSDLDTSTESLLAHLFAVAALTGVSPRSTVENLMPFIEDDHQWYSRYLPEIMGDSEDILG